MKFGVVTFPGSNCDQDMIYTLETTLGQQVEKLWHKDTDLKGVDFVVLPGGFSYGDYLRSGAIAKYSPIMKEVIAHGQKGGYVMGICNGFQILCESPLLDGALLHNDTQKFICKNVYLRPKSRTAAISKDLASDKAVKIPIAHGEGRFFAPEDIMTDIYQNDQILFQYCDADGNVNDTTNPNGSLNNIAGITNKGKNIFGMMPHPERAADANLGNTDGKLLFESILSNI
ncbi:MAG: phosphoribosylformylglycinamidine synthase I [Arenicella sp.]|jgi:phosphoribosylformylglycinamidine synthase I